MQWAEWKGRALRLLGSYKERAPLALNASLALNLLYALFKMIAGIWVHSFWMIGLGGYYGMLAVMRFLLMRQLRREAPAAARRAYRRTAWLLLALTLVMAGIIGQTFVTGGTYDYPGMLIYAFAAYAFWKIVSAVAALIRKRNDENRVLAAARCVTFAQALMSILALQVALINRFGGEDGPGFARLMNGAVGAVICLLVVLMAVLMLVRSAKEKR